MSIKENWLFLGNPGVGKSTLLNCLIGRQEFNSGLSHGEGLTKEYRRVVVDGIAYMDTPGLADVRMIKQAAHEITIALRQSGRYKLFFLVRLQSGRLVEEDLVTIERVLDAVKVNNVTFSVILNNVPRRQFGTLMERGEKYELVKSTINRCKYQSSGICVVPKIDELEESCAVVRLPDHVYKFVREEAPVIVIPEPQVDEVDPRDLYLRLEALRKEIAEMQRMMSEMLMQALIQQQAHEREMAAIREQYVCDVYEGREGIDYTNYASSESSQCSDPCGWISAIVCLLTVGGILLWYLEQMDSS
ncbi:hypothetical protein PINS_up006006 [Pythium insidiosum]|nr:hypothetical protein PINS_up006006 [Pythium insidiosum]